MKFLPIVSRELQLAARRPSTYRIRVVTVLLSVSVCAYLLFRFASLGTMGAGVQGARLFNSLAVIAFIFSSLAGVFVCSDSVSREKRDGTLGLLFLTPLRPMDVVFGKFFAFGLNLFYGLLAFVPILAMTWQMGGVREGTVVMTVLVLVNTLFLSICIALFVSSISKDERKAFWASIGSVLLVFIGPFVIAGYLANNNAYSQPGLAVLLTPFFLMLSPMVSLDMVIGGFLKSITISNVQVFNFSTGHFRLGLGPVDLGFVLSLFVPHMLAWVLLFRSGRVIGGMISGTPKSRFWESIRIKWHYFLYGKGDQRRKHRQWLLDHHPMTWMVMREKLKLKYAWTLVVAVVFIWVFGYMANGEVMAEPPVLISLGLFVHFFLKLWVASEAASVIAEDRRTGALELVVTTPLGARGIVNGIFKASLLQFWKPVCLLIAAELMLVFTLAAPDRQLNLPLARSAYVASMLMLVVDMASIGWVAIWYALKTGSTHKAIGRSVGWMLAVPWIVYLLARPIWDYLWFPLVQWWVEDSFPAGSSQPRSYHSRAFDEQMMYGRVVFWCLLGMGWNYWFAWKRMRGNVLGQFQTMVSESGIQKSKD